MATPVAIETIGWRYYLVFLIISAIIVPTVYFGFPETMGRSLEELEVMFEETDTIRGIVKESRKPLTSGLGYRERIAEKGGMEEREMEKA
jgi:hypothetical protein